MNVTVIRNIREADARDWRTLWQGYLDFYRTVLPEDVTDTTWRRLLDPAEPLFGLIAERDGLLAGFAHCVLHRGTWSLGDQCYLEDLYVAPGARGVGTGRALIEAVYREADHRGADRVYWLTHETNSTARALYERVAQRSGFIHYTR
jgi:GNAT superfamily N-acetyltransferase